VNRLRAGTNQQGQSMPFVAVPLFIPYRSGAVLVRELEVERGLESTTTSARPSAASSATRIGVSKRTAHLATVESYVERAVTTTSVDDELVD
jgi:hypothetical protein